MGRALAGARACAPRATKSAAARALHAAACIDSSRAPTSVAAMQGASIAYAMLSALPHMNDKMSVVIAMAPVFFLDHLRAPFLKSMGMAHNEQFFVEFGMGEFLWVRACAAGSVLIDCSAVVACMPRRNSCSKLSPPHAHRAHAPLQERYTAQYAQQCRGALYADACVFLVNSMFFGPR